MKHDYSISIWSLITAILLTIITVSLSKAVLIFALFWLSILGFLLALINKKVWTSGEWLGFAAFSTTTLTGVLFSAHLAIDRIGLGITVLGLLLVTAVVNAINEPRKKVKKSLYAVSTSKGKKYHRPECNLLKAGQEQIKFSNKEQAQLSGRTACSRCF